MTRPSDRVLYLDDESRLGEPIDDCCWRCNWEFWFQLLYIVPAADDDGIVTDELAVALADAIEPDLDQFNWLLHLSLWGDPEGIVVRQFLSWLRHGSFNVVDLREILPTEYVCEDEGQES